MSITPIDPAIFSQVINYVIGTDPAANDSYITKDAQAISGLAADQDRIRDYINTLIEAIVNQAGTINANDIDMDDRITSNAGSIASIGTDVGQLQSDVSTAQGDIITLQGDTVALDARLDTAEINIDSNTTDISNQVTSLASLNSAVTDVYEKINNVFGDAYIYGEYDSFSDLPNNYAVRGQYYGVGNATNHIGDLVYILAGYEWLEVATVAYSSSDIGSLPEASAEHVFGLVANTTLYQSYLDYTNGDAGEMTWQEYTTIEGWVATVGDLLPPEPVENYFLLAKVDNIVTDQSNLPANPNRRDVYAVDPTGALTPSTMYFSHADNTWVLLDYVPNYLLYIYKGTDWIRLGEHDVSVDRFVDWMDVGVLDGTTTRKFTFASGRADLPYTGSLANGTYIIIAYSDNINNTNYVYLEADTFLTVYSNGDGINLTGNVFSAKPNTAQNFNADANGIGAAPGYQLISDEQLASITPTTVFMAPNGTRTLFIVPGMTDTKSVTVLLNGVVQDPRNDYTRNGDNLLTTLGYAIPSSSSFIVVYQ
jgi:hypothetical protein